MRRGKMKKYQSLNVILMALFICVFIYPSSAQYYGIAVVKQWGEFGDKPGQLKYPTMIAADNNSNIFVVDQHNHRIQKFDPEGNFITMWGKQGDQLGKFNYPYGIAIDSKGNV